MGGDHAELAQRARAAAIIAAAADRIARQRLGDLAGAAEQQQRLGPRRRLVIIAGRGDGRVGEQVAGNRPRLRRVPRQQRQRRGVDAGEGIAAVAVDGVIGVVRADDRLLPPGAGRRGERAVLEQPRPDRPLMRVVRPVQPVSREQPHRPLGVAHPGQREDLLVADRPARIALRDRGGGDVIGRDQIAAREGGFGEIGGLAHRLALWGLT